MSPGTALWGLALAAAGPSHGIRQFLLLQRGVHRALRWLRDRRSRCEHGYRGSRDRPGGRPPVDAPPPAHGITAVHVHPSASCAPEAVPYLRHRQGPVILPVPLAPLAARGLVDRLHVHSLHRIALSSRLLSPAPAACCGRSADCASSRAPLAAARSAPPSSARIGWASSGARSASPWPPPCVAARASSLPRGRSLNLRVGVGMASGFSLV